MNYHQLGNENKAIIEAKQFGQQYGNISYNNGNLKIN